LTLQAPSSGLELELELELDLDLDLDLQLPRTVVRVVRVVSELSFQPVGDRR